MTSPEYPFRGGPGAPNPHPFKPEPPEPAPNDKARKARTSVIGGTALAALLASLAVYESSGKHYGRPYYDSAKVLTVCDGLTGAWIDPNRYYTPDECLKAKAAYVTAMSRTLGGDQCMGAMAPEEWVAWGHFGYNIGTSALCKSTAAKLWRTGEKRKACEQMGRWTNITLNGKLVNCRTAGHLCPGLPKRRDYEVDLCLKAVTP